LKYLTLLTYADISAVNPEAMTPWRLEQLWRTYLVAYRELTRELDTDRIASPRDAAPEFADGFPRRYLRTHTATEIAAHADLVETATGSGVALDLRRDHGFWRLAIAAADRTGLLAAFAGVLAGFGMNIVKAEAFANRGGMVLDTFVFEDPMRTLELNPEEVDRLRKVLKRAALGKEDVSKLLKGRAPAAKVPDRVRVRPAVAFDSEASASATLVEIVAQDRPGLLYDLARTFAESDCAIEVVLLDTKAHKAIDVFYVTRGHAKLGPDLQDKLKADLLSVCL
jgi:[protein-PII] uridylyltransferase